MDFVNIGYLRTAERLSLAVATGVVSGPASPGASLTSLAELPPGAQRSLRDPFAQRKTPWKTYIVLAVLIAVLGELRYLGVLQKAWHDLRARTTPVATQPAAAKPEGAKVEGAAKPEAAPAPPAKAPAQ
jgi:hypothetical protein